MSDMKEMLKKNRKKALSLAVAAVFTAGLSSNFAGCTTNQKNYNQEDDDDDDDSGYGGSSGYHGNTFWHSSSSGSSNEKVNSSSGNKGKVRQVILEEKVEVHQVKEPCLQ